MAGFDTFWNQAAPILSLDTGKLARREELGSELYFSKTPRIVSAVQRLISSIQPDQADVIPDPLWQTLTRDIQRFAEICVAILNFDPKSNNPVAQRNSLENDLAQQYNVIFGNLTLVSSTTASTAELGNLPTRFDELEKALSSRMVEIADSAGRKASEAEALLNQAVRRATEETEAAASAIKLLLEETRNRAAEVISTKEASHFAEARDEFKRSAGRWLYVTAGGVIALFVLASGAFLLAELGHYEDLSTKSLAQIALSKVVLFGVVGYLTAQSAKNYFAAKHNEAVNHHRQNAILAYRALVEATGAPEHRDIVLTHAASAVFTPQDTAFVKGSGSPAELPTTFINSVSRAIAPSA